MGKELMRVSEILAMYQQAQKDKRIPAKQQKPRDPDAFELIFKEKCEEVKNDGHGQG